MILLAVILLVCYAFFRHPVLLWTGGLLLVIALVLALSSAGGMAHYSYY